MPDKKYHDLISSKWDGKIFLPYIPLVGRHYDEERILIYCTAQNLTESDKLAKEYNDHFEKLSRRLYYSRRFKREYPKDRFSYRDVDITPYQAGVVPALVSVFMAAKFGEFVEDLSGILDRTAVSNFFKFSLNKGTADLNPIQRNNKHYSELKDYRCLNDKLVRLEIEALRPKWVIVFGTELEEHLDEHLKDVKQKHGFEVVAVNDPSWILQGAGGCLQSDVKWGKEVKEAELGDLRGLVDCLLPKIEDAYKSKQDAVKIYLLKYALEWLRQSASSEDLPPD